MYEPVVKAKEGEDKRLGKGFYLDGRSFYPDSLTVQTWIGRHKDDYYATETYPPEQFLEMLVNAALRQGRHEIQDLIKSALGMRG